MMPGMIPNRPVRSDFEEVEGLDDEERRDEEEDERDDDRACAERRVEPFPFVERFVRRPAAAELAGVLEPLERRDAQMRVGDGLVEREPCLGVLDLGAGALGRCRLDDGLERCRDDHAEHDVEVADAPRRVGDMKGPAGSALELDDPVERPVPRD
jgi:hypothetical protein